MKKEKLGRAVGRLTALGLGVAGMLAATHHHSIALSTETCGSTTLEAVDFPRDAHTIRNVGQCALVQPATSTASRSPSEALLFPFESKETAIVVCQDTQDNYVDLKVNGLPMTVRVSPKAAATIEQSGGVPQCDYRAADYRVPQLTGANPAIVPQGY